MSAAPGRRSVGTNAACYRAPCEFKFYISTGHLWGSVGHVTINAVEMKLGRVPHGLDNPRQAAGFENLTGPGLFVKSHLAVHRWSQRCFSVGLTVASVGLALTRSFIERRAAHAGVSSAGFNGAERIALIGVLIDFWNKSIVEVHYASWTKEEEALRRKGSSLQEDHYWAGSWTNGVR